MKYQHVHKVSEMYLHDKLRKHGGPCSAGKTVLQKHQ